MGAAMNWDAVVIGAGPAGSVTARELARRGCRVLMVDKSSFPRAKVCGCCLNGAAIGTLERLGLGDVLKDAVRLDRVTVAAGSRTADMRLPRGAALSREVFDERLVEQAVKEGVEFRAGTVVNRPRDLLSEARIVIVASGLTGGDAMPEPGSRIGAGVVIPAKSAPEFYKPHTIHMATGRGGYVGFVRVEDGRLDVAAALDAAFVKLAGGLGPAAEAILSQADWPIPVGLAEAVWRGTPALTRRPARLADDRLFVVGDAAGYVEPFTGEGMAWAIMSAAELAPIAARAVQLWNDSLANEWELKHRRIVGQRQRVCRIVSRVLRSPLFTGLAVRTLQLAPVLSRPVIAALNRPSPRGSPV
jgi:flavin-dependent dehydrogenase